MTKYNRQAFEELLWETLWDFHYSVSFEEGGETDASIKHDKSFRHGVDNIHNFIEQAKKEAQIEALEWIKEGGVEIVLSAGGDEEETALAIRPQGIEDKINQLKNDNS